MLQFWEHGTRIIVFKTCSRDAIRVRALGAILLFFCLFLDIYHEKGKFLWLRTLSLSSRNGFKIQTINVTLILLFYEDDTLKLSSSVSGIFWHILSWLPLRTHNGGRICYNFEDSEGPSPFLSFFDRNHKKTNTTSFIFKLMLFLTSYKLQNRIINICRYFS